MKRLSSLAICLMCLCLAFHPSFAAPALQDDFAGMPMSAWGIRGGHGSFSIGASLALAHSDLPVIPLLHFRYTHGFADWLNVSVGFNAVVLINYFDISIRWRFYGHPNFSVALKTDLTAAVGIWGGLPPPSSFGGWGSLFAMTNSLAFSTGNRWFQFTLEAGVVLDSLGSANFRDGIRFEFRVSRSVSLYLIGSVFGNPIAAVGASINY